MEEIELPSGHCLLRVWKEGLGWEYVSDEIGGGVLVWCPALVDVETLEAAIADWRCLGDRRWGSHD